MQHIFEYLSKGPMHNQIVLRIFHTHDECEWNIVDGQWPPPSLLYFIPM